MADSASSTDPLERYGAIEKAYCDERWGTVIQDGQTLLAALPRSGEAPEGLKERLQLLMAHAYLYGFGDRDNAEDLYQAVLHSGGEASLRQIAEQGLQECTRPVAVSRPPEEQWQVEPAVEPQEVVLPSFSVAVPDSSAAPQAAVTSDTLPEPAAQNSWLTAEPADVSPAAATSPVMPWLATAPAVAVAPALQAPSALPSEPAAPVLATAEAATLRSAAPMSTEWSEDRSSAPTLDPDERDVPLVATPLEQTSEQPAAWAEPADPGTSWLSGGAAVAAATLASASGAVAPERAESVFTGIPPATEDATAEPAPVLDAAWEEPLVPEVIEEPELLEVHQADPLRAEELEVRVRESLPAVGMGGAPDASEAIVAAAEDMATTRLTLAKSESDELEGLAPGLEDPSPQEEGRGEPPSWDRQAADLSAGMGLIGLGPFSAPPEQVDEEDPELLLGLLRVEMG